MQRETFAEMKKILRRLKYDHMALMNDEFTTVC